MMSNSLTLSFLFQVDVGNPNAGWTEGVVQVLKKIERPDGETHPYVSGQAMRHYIRSTMTELLGTESSYGTFSQTKMSEDSKAPVTTEGDPRKYIDDDVFGFMNATKKRTWKREAPLRVSPAYGLFPYHGDRDLGTRSAVEQKGAGDAGGSIFETEITNNVFRSTLLLELDRIGKWKKFESVDDKEGEISSDVRKQRIKLLLSSLKYLWGGGRNTRLLVDLTPQFVIYARMTKKIPIFLTGLNIAYKDGQYRLDTKVLKEVVSDYKQDIETLVVGVKSGFIGNVLELPDAFDIKSGQILTVPQAVGSMLDDVDRLDFSSENSESS